MNNGVRRLTNTSQPSCLGVNNIQPMQIMWENCEPQTYCHWLWVRSKELSKIARENISKTIIAWRLHGLTRGKQFKT